jgi:hypothetical protein
MRPLAAHCHLGLGTLYREIGRGDQAQAELTTAAELYRAMETTFWLARGSRAGADRVGPVAKVAPCIDSGGPRWDDAGGGWGAMEVV